MITAFPALLSVDLQTPLSDGWLAYAKLTLVLAGVLIGAYVAVRYGLPRLSLARASQGPIEIRARLALEPRKSLYLVALGTARLLIATSETGVSFLTRVESSDLQETGSSNAPPPQNDKDFKSFIRAFRDRKDV